MKKLLAWGCLALASACAGPDEGRRVEPLPFHVAIRMDEVLELPGEADEEAPTYQLSQSALAEAIEAELREYGATEVTVLQESQGGSQDDANGWLSQAREAGADVLLDCRVSYRSQYQSERNEKFWLNLPLFLLLGTLNLFVDDRDYSTEARLAARVVDLHTVYADRADLSSSRVQFFNVDERFDRMTMDFIDRDGHKSASMFYSFFIPSGFLATETEAAAVHLGEGVTSDLAARLVTFLDGRRESLLKSPQLYPFWPEIEGWTARRVGSELAISGQVYMQVDERASGMKRWELVAGASTLASEEFDFGEFDELNSIGETEVLRYPIDIRVPAPSGRSVQLALTDSNDYRRSFTLGIDRQPVILEDD